MATNKESLIVRLRAACNGLPGAVIAWPHRILHEAAEELAAANARIAELEARCAKAGADSTRLDKLQESFIKGEEFHGPIVETADIPEANLFKLFAAYDAEIEALRAQVAALTGTLSAISDDSMSRANGDMWLLYYEDADERPVLFQTREALKAAEHRALTQWACHPFAPLTEYEALRAKLADLEARLATAEGEVVRLNQWADGMTDIALKERATGEAYQRELRDKIADLEAKVEKAPCSDFCRDAKEKHHIPYTEHHHACWKVEALGLEGQDYMRRTEAK